LSTPTSFYRFPKGGIQQILNTKITRALAAVAPAEAGSIGRTVSVVWKEETAVFVRDRFRVERTALEIDGGQKEVVKAVQDEASPTPLPGEPLKAKNLLLGEGQSLLRAHFSKSTSIFGVLFFLEWELRTTHQPGGEGVGGVFCPLVCMFCPLVHVFVRWCEYICR
jgi:hypothetical protein